MIRIKLSRMMGDRRISQTELSRITGINKHTINDLYQDLADRVSLEQLDAICDALNCSLDDILEWTPNDSDRGESNRKPSSKKH